MKKTELILIIVVVIALIMKLFHIAGASVLLVLSLSTLGILYFYLGFALFNNLELKQALDKASFSNISSKRVVGAMITGFALGIAAVGILFRMQSWAGAVMIMFTGIVLLSIISITTLYHLIRKKNQFYSGVLKRVLGFVIFMISIMAIPSKTWLEWKYPNNPAYVQAVLEAQANPDDVLLWEKVEEERKKMIEERGQ